MRVDRLINVLSEITLIEMTVTIGLGVKFSDVLRVSQGLWAGHSRPTGKLHSCPCGGPWPTPVISCQPNDRDRISRRCGLPGAPYGTSFTAMAKGNVAVSVGLMVILAASSAIVVPLLLQFLLPIVAGDIPLRIKAIKMVGTLLGAQLLPLWIGLMVRQRFPAWAERFKKPAGVLSLLLNLLLLAVILFVQFRVLLEIRLMGYIGMSCLVIAAVASGWLMGGRESEDRKGMVFTTTVRNVGVSLVIVTTSFPGTLALGSATAYALFQTIVIALVAWVWGRFMPACIQSVKMRAA